MQFTVEELQEIYQSAHNNLECLYEGDYQNVDLLSEPDSKFSDEDPAHIEIWKNICKKSKKGIQEFFE